VAGIRPLGFFGETSRRHWRSNRGRVTCTWGRVLLCGPGRHTIHLRPIPSNIPDVGDEFVPSVKLKMAQFGRLGTMPNPGLLLVSQVLIRRRLKSGRQDLNQRPHGPEPEASRRNKLAYTVVATAEQSGGPAFQPMNPEGSISISHSTSSPSRPKIAQPPSPRADHSYVSRPTSVPDQEV
jgi:hypothetical protein